MAWWPLGRSRREPAAGVASTAASAAPRSPAPVSLPAEPEGAWRDLPSVQRTLAEPLRPVAIGDDFRQSLASFNDPSFVAPLSHQVDPSTGGLVDGLASPGQPYAHPSVADLPVPARPAAPAAPRVQRSVAWSGSTDLPTVSWELPGLAADEPVEPSPESPPVTSGQVEPATPVPASVLLQLRAAPVPAAPPQAPCRCSVRWRRCRRARRRRGVVPPIPLASFRSWSPGRRRTARRRRSVDAGGPAHRRRRRWSAGGRTRSRASPAQRICRRRSPVWVARTRFRPSPPSRAPAADDRPVAGPSIQRLTADVEAPVRPDSAPMPRPRHADWCSSAACPPSPGSRRVRIAVACDRRRRLRCRWCRGSWIRLAPEIRVRRRASASRCSRAGDPARRADDAPTLGPGLAQKPLAVQRAPLTGRTALPAEPPVQRVEFLAPQVATASSPSMTPDSGRRPRGPGVRRRALGQILVAGESPSAIAPTPAVTAAPSVQRALEDYRPAGVSSKPEARNDRASPSRSRRRRSSGRGGRVSARGSRRGRPRWTPCPRPPDPSCRWSRPRPIVPPDLPAPTPPVTTDPGRPDLGGPAVSAEPWVADPGRLRSGQRRFRQRRFSQRRFRHRRFRRPPFSGSSHRPCRPDLACSGSLRVGRSGVRGVPLPAGRVEPDGRRRSADSRAAQRRAPHRSGFEPVVDSCAADRFAPGGGKRSPGIVASGREHVLREHVRLAAGLVTPRRRRPFRRPPTTGVHQRVHQRAPVRRHRRGPSEPAGEPAPSAPASSAAPAPRRAGTPPTDLDEMARRLYEPLSARLRAELWLDRERAGVMSDA